MKTHFGFSIWIISRHTRAMFLNAKVTVLVADCGQISRHFWSAWWSDFLWIFVLPQFVADPVPSTGAIRHPADAIPLAALVAILETTVPVFLTFPIHMVVVF